MKIKKLAFKKTTITKLSDNDLKQIVGGHTNHSCVSIEILPGDNPGQSVISCGPRQA